MVSDAQEISDVVNVVTAPLLERMDRTAERVPAAESEFDIADVERAPCRTITPPRVAEAPVTMECRLYDSMTIYDRILIFGEVQYVHLLESVLVDGEIDMRTLRTVRRLGGSYYTVADPVEYERQY